MEHEINQDPNQINPDEAKAALGLATRLSGELMPKAPQPQETAPTSEPSQEEGEVPAQEEKVDLEANNKEMEKVMDTKLDELRKEIKDTIKEEMSSIKESIENALKEDE